jgi:tetratricopeptide (TPR) repeat protein
MDENAMHLGFYAALSDYERRLYHMAVAQALAQLVEQQPDPSNELALAVAYHYQVCGEGLSAARHHYMAAVVSFAHDQFEHSAQLCREAMTIMSGITLDDTPDPQLHIDVIMLYLLSIEGLIMARPAADEEDHLDRLIGEADVLATRANDARLRAKARYLRAKFTLYTHGLAASIPLFEDAHQIAVESGDVIMAYYTQSDLGFYVVGQDLLRGLALMEDAHRLYETEIKDSYRGLERANLERSYYHLKGRIGVVKFDEGDYEEALEWLNASYDNLRSSKLAPTSYICQPYTAMGMFEEAEALLKQDLELARSEEALNSFVIYNLSLLGKLYLEWGKIQEAAHYLTESWAKAKAMELTWLMTLVGNYHTELLMHEQFDARDLGAAARDAEMIADMARKAGWHRSVVTALSLRGQIALVQGQIDEAVRYSSEAVAYLQDRGLLPATRAEEIYFNHYNVLRTAGRTAEAEQYLRLAHRTLLEKLNSLSDERQRQSMIERVAINQTILTTVQQILQ